MTQVLILYYSKYSATYKMAKKIAEGVEKGQATAVLRTVPEVSPNCEQTEETIPEQGAIYVTKSDLETCDGIILGSPTRFGNMAAPMKHFIDTTSDLWFKGTLVNKPAAVFTSTASLHGGQETTLLSMMIPLLHHGAIITGIPYTEADLQQTTTGGTPYGPSHLAGPNSNNPLSTEEINLCKALGQRIATLSQKLK